TLGVQVRRDLHDRLLATGARADALATAGTPPEQLADQLGGGSVRALLVTAAGISYGDPAINPNTAPGPGTPLPPPRPPARPSGGPVPPAPPPSPPDATATVVIHPLPTGGRVILVADTTQATQVMRDLRELMLGAGLLTLAVAVLLLRAVARGALRPLDRLTALARDITTGDRGRRLRPDRTETELGQAAAAFDGMLDALESAEQRANHAADQAQAAADTARKAEAQTRRFLADAAHELRTPLAGIQVSAEQLAGATNPAEHRQQRRAQLLLSESRRAARLVSDMLDLSRIDAGLPLHTQDTDLGAIVVAEIERAAMLAPALTITHDGPAHLPIRADPTRIAQILSNLLDNARRYTPAGGRIELNLRLRADDESEGWADLTVTDTGPGIPDRDRDRVFDRLVRLDAARHRDHGGAGLGLPIARALARAHHGELTCQPHHPGARFLLTLPLTRPTAGQRTSAHPL
ncbi:MAG: HAMP domain-containing histidine kinase, partial [Actinomycetota bacterium]|nr:HAMP domain-containing histidine kinase [Actinomycetota bacterium]